MSGGERRKIVRTAVAIGIATGTYGISFGVLSVAAGLTAAQTCAMSLLVFTGASQFAAVGVLGSGGSAAAAIAPALLLAGRNALYGLSLVSVLRGRPASRAAQSQLVIDETTAMARAQGDAATAQFAFLATGISVFVCWNAGTALGALAGRGLADPSALGLDAMFPAAFLALLAPQLRRPGAPAAAVAGAVIATVLVPLTPAGVPILASALGVVAGLAARRRARRGGSG
ncbi:MAG TPA: AzlC family ABC transporter permease [Gaiellales bacterium]|nr:AzlC family ABC transporter permease [Gaiellales bacterium]